LNTKRHKIDKITAVTQIYWFIFEVYFFHLLFSDANTIRHYVFHNYCYDIPVSMPMLTTL
jgi:hypothetical protein